MTTPAFINLIAAARSAHDSCAPIRAFCRFPDDLTETPWTPFWIPAAELMEQEDRWADSVAVPTLFDAFLGASADARWRETYKGTEIGDDFMNRFGCFCMIGPDAPWTSEQMFGFVVYMPPHLWYPWHQHPAEELYFVIAGSGEFFREGEPTETLVAGQGSFHASGQPHALRTHEAPLMAYVIWRNNFDTAPYLCPGRSLAPPEAGPVQ